MSAVPPKLPFPLRMLKERITLFNAQREASIC